MFKKRVKKIYPEGTFIPTSARIFAILQLCLAFTVILWNAGEPFMGRLFQVKSQVLLYDLVLEQKDDYLSENEIKNLLVDYEKVKEIAKTGFWDKIRESVHILFIDMHPYEKAWILFSILLPILLLKKVEGAQYALWILPLLVAVYCMDNALHGKPLILTKEAALFPKESYLIENYMKEPFGKSIAEQHNQLQHAWNIYLIKEWAHEEPSEINFNQQLKRGNFFFNLARLKGLPEIKSEWRTKQSLWLLIFYFFWHLLAVIICTRALIKQRPWIKETAA